MFLPHHWTSPHILEAGLSVSVLSSTASRLMFRLDHVSRAQAGLYSCKVSTYSDETTATARLAVIGEQIKCWIDTIDRQLRQDSYNQTQSI